MNKRGTRSRTGCLKCKERRLKCDETQPACQQCQRRNATCPGYRAPVRWSRKYEVFRSEQQQPHGRRQAASAQASSYSWDTESSYRNVQPNQNQQDASLASQNYGTQPATSLVDPMNQDIMMDSSPRFDDIAQNQAQATMMIPSNSLSHLLGNTCNMTSATGESGVVSDDLEQFALTDQEFWSALTLPWSPNVLEQARFPESAPPMQANPLLLGHGPSVSSADKELDKEPLSFDESDGTNEGTRVLLRHYFENILNIMCVFDSSNNPFRYLVSGYVKSSSLVRNCILSLSAAHLMSNDQSMYRKVVQYHSDALRCLATAMEQIENIDSSAESASTSQPEALIAYNNRLQEALFALLLLFNSASWLDPSDIGVNHLFNARRLFSKWLDSVKRLSGGHLETAMHDRNTSFIIGVMAYCEAIFAFVFDQPIDSVDYLEPFCHQSGTTMVHPNPWTGVGTPIFIAMAQIGICVRQRRAILRLHSLGWPEQVYKGLLEEVSRRATITEKLVLEYELPTRNQIVSDQKVQLDALSELESMAYTYKLAALLELYRSFPQLGVEDVEVPQSAGRSPSLSSAHSIPPRSKGHITNDTEADHDKNCKIIYELAINMFGLLKETREYRATSLAHTLALIIGGSALRRWPAKAPSVSSQDLQSAPLRGKVTALLAQVNMRPEVVEGWRSFVRQRLKSNADFVHLKSYKRTQTLMEEIWSRLDNQEAESRPSVQRESGILDGQPCTGDGSAHWLDVMMECRLETIFG